MIHSPNYPEKYASSDMGGSMQCHWFINVSPGHRILLFFETFEVEGKLICDILTIFFGFLRIFYFCDFFNILAIFRFFDFSMFRNFIFRFFTISIFFQLHNDFSIFDFSIFRYFVISIFRI